MTLNLKEIKYGISYKIETIKYSGDFAEREKFEINPTVVVCMEGKEHERFRLKKPVYIAKKFSMQSDKKSFFSMISSEIQSCQERIIADHICSIILREARDNHEDRLVFFIEGNFETDKIIGRLAYLGLPAERIIILFVSRKITDLLANNIVSQFDSIKWDYSFLNEPANKGQIFGPYPEDDTISLIKTFYITHDKDELYPVKVDMFYQFLTMHDINEKKEILKNDYFSVANTELYEFSGLRKPGKTRLPKLLIESLDITSKLPEEY